MTKKSALSTPAVMFFLDYVGSRSDTSHPPTPSTPAAPAPMRASKGLPQAEATAPGANGASPQGQHAAVVAQPSVPQAVPARPQANAHHTNGVGSQGAAEGPSYDQHIAHLRAQQQQMQQLLQNQQEIQRMQTQMQGPAPSVHRAPPRGVSGPPGRYQSAAGTSAAPNIQAVSNPPYNAPMALHDLEPNGVQAQQNAVAMPVLQNHLPVSNAAANPGLRGDAGMGMGLPQGNSVGRITHNDRPGDWHGRAGPALPAPQFFSQGAGPAVPLHTAQPAFEEQPFSRFVTPVTANAGPPKPVSVQPPVDTRAGWTAAQHRHEPVSNAPHSDPLMERWLQQGNDGPSEVPRRTVDGPFEVPSRTVDPDANPPSGITADVDKALERVRQSSTPSQSPPGGTHAGASHHPIEHGSADVGPQAGPQPRTNSRMCGVFGFRSSGVAAMCSQARTREGPAGAESTHVSVGAGAPVPGTGVRQPRSSRNATAGASSMSFQGWVFGSDDGSEVYL